MNELMNNASSIEIQISTIVIILLLIVALALYKLIKVLNRVNKMLGINEERVNEIIELNGENSILINNILNDLENPHSDIGKLIKNAAVISEDVQKVTSATNKVVTVVETGIETAEGMIGNASKIASLVKTAKEKCHSNVDEGDNNE